MLWKVAFYMVLCLPFCLSSIAVSELTLEEKVGQLLLVHFYGQEANEDAKYLIQSLYVGGIIYYNWANELSHPQQVLRLSQSLQQLACETPHAIPLLIAIDQEGGCVNRLKHGFTHFPGNYALGQTGKWQWGEESAWMMGQELKAVGISLNLAPVVDIYTQPANPVIGIRAFSSHPHAVASWASYALRGYKRAEVIAVLKHFPGHGDVCVDSHEALPSVIKSRERLEEVELYPFRFLASQADAIMTAHLFVPDLDAQQCVTFSQKIVKEILRENFSFEGVILTDSLAMEGILRQCASLEEVAEKSLEAGHDVLLLGGKQLLSFQRGFEFTIDAIKRVHHYLVNAVKQGKLSEQRLNASVTRILALKQRYGLWNRSSSTAMPSEISKQATAHSTLAQCIARHALRLFKGRSKIPLVSSLLLIAPACLREELNQVNWQFLRMPFSTIYFDDVIPEQKFLEQIQSELSVKNQICIFVAYNAWRSPVQQKLFNGLKQLTPHVWAILVGNPLDLAYLSTADVLLCTFSPVAYSLQAAFDYLTGEQEALQSTTKELTNKELFE